MQKMADSAPELEGVDIKISVMPDANKLILANSAGNTPDVALGLMSFMPFDLAIRGALYNLAEFDDFWLVANRFAPGALVPYILEDGVYAMPETLDFSALVYRTDVFNAFIMGMLLKMVLIFVFLFGPNQCEASMVVTTKPSATININNTGR